MLSADQITVKGGIFLNDGFKAKGEVRFRGADIAGQLACGNGTFENPGGDALSADQITVKGSVFLTDGFNAKGEVRFLGADIGGLLGCNNGTFENPNGDALSADRISVKGRVFLTNGFNAKGGVRFLGADIGGLLGCSAGTFENPDGDALSADRISVKGSVFLTDGFKAKGVVRFESASIDGNLSCQLAEFATRKSTDAPNDSIVFSLESARVNGIFHWWPLKSHGQITFAHAKVGGLHDNPNCWPERGSLNLNGFVYDEFSFDAPATAVARVDWLRRQQPFRTQPYEQAIRVLRRMGHDRDAREIAIAKQIALRESGLMSRRGMKWNRFLELTVAYGYKPWKALIYVIMFWVLGMAVFDAGHSFRLMSPADSRVFLHEDYVKSGGTWLPSDYPRFKAPIYSLDVFLPIVDLHQESRWLPNTRNGWGWIIWSFMWLHIMAGWVLTSVFVAALTGIIKKE